MRALPRQGAHILLVEDNEINQEVASDILQDLGLVVDIADNGAEAVAMTGQTRYDLILMDMPMPEMDGLEATRRIRAQENVRPVPIIAITANAFEEDRERCEAAGMNDFVAKPVESARLRRMLARWLPDPAENSAAVPASGQPFEAPKQVVTAPEPVLDFATGLRYFFGKRANYLRMLAKFIENHDNDADRIALALATGQHETAQRMAHTIKGTGAVLGLVALSQSARILEFKLSQGAQEASLEEGLSLLRSMLAEVGDAVDHILMDPERLP